MPEIDVPKLTIFSQPRCVQCTAAKRRVEAQGIPFQIIDVTEVPEALTLIKEEWKHLAAPVLYFDGKHVAGFDPDFIDTAGNKLAAAA